MSTEEMVEALAAALMESQALPQRLLEAGEELPEAGALPLEERVYRAQTPAELLEKCATLRKTSLQVYCRKSSTDFGERFRGEGRRAEMVVEVVATAGRLEELRPRAMRYADAIADVLRQRAGCLKPELFLRNQTEVVYEPAKKGGLHLVEVVRVFCTLEWKKGTVGA
jgi:hypothetical protein